MEQKDLLNLLAMLLMKQELLKVNVLIVQELILQINLVNYLN